MDDRLTIPTDSIWAVEEHRFAQIMAALRGVRPDAAMMTSPLETGFRREGRAAIIDIVGPLTKSPSWWSRYIDTTSYAGIRRAIRGAIESDASTIVLRVDSPGGSTDGLPEAGDAIFEARSAKPVVAFVEGMAASAAYYLASQAQTIVAQQMDYIGSIGTRLMLYDFSELFQKEGVRAIPIDTGEFKSAGAMGTKITENQVAYFQGLVDAHFKNFLSAIQRGRGLTGEKLQAVADGRVFLAAEALSLGLIDGIEKSETFVARWSSDDNRKGRGQTKAAKESTMSSDAKVAAAETDAAAETKSSGTQNTAVLRVESTAATLGELKSAIPDSTAEFREKCIEQGFTLPQAQTAWMTVLRDQVKAKDAELTKAKAEKVAPGTEGVAGTKGSPGASGDGPEAEWKAALDAKIAAGFKHNDAVSALAREKPELHKAYIAAYNERNGRKVA